MRLGLHRDRRGGTGYVEALIVVALIGFAVLAGVRLFGSATEEKFEQEAAWLSSGGAEARSGDLPVHAPGATVAGEAPAAQPAAPPPPAARSRTGRVLDGLGHMVWGGLGVAGGGAAVAGAIAGTGMTAGLGTPAAVFVGALGTTAAAAGSVELTAGATMVWDALRGNDEDPAVAQRADNAAYVGFVAGAPQTAYGLWQLGRAAIGMVRRSSSAAIVHADDVRCPGGVCTREGACFAAGTLVETERGPRPIETIRAGDRVLARDPGTGIEAWKPVVRTFATEGRELGELDLRAADGSVETVAVTPEHPFFVEGRGWVPAADLDPGLDVVAGQAGGALDVVAARTLGGATTVFNLEVADFHTYFVGEAHAWVHNQCQLPRLSTGAAARRAHDELTHDLYNGRVIDARQLGSDGANPIYRVRLRDPSTGRERDALFKPRAYGDAGGWNRVPVEYVGYQLNRLLDMDYVPPVAYRRNIDVDFRNWSEGAFLHFVPDGHRLRAVPADQLGFRKDLFDSDVRILDVLLQNSDRHQGNVLRGKHWVDGEYRPILIDQGAGLRQGANVSMTFDDGLGWSYNHLPIEVVRQRTHEALQRLDFDTLKGRFGEFVSDREIRDILHRRDGIVRYFEELARKRGRDKVIIHDNN